MAVYTEVSDEELAQLHRQLWPGRAAVLQGHRRGRREHQLSSCTPTTGPFILTLYEKRVESPHDLPFFLGLMEHLAEHGVTCPTPVRDAEGRILRRACRPAGRARHVPRRLLGAAADSRALRRARASAGAAAPGGAGFALRACQRARPCRLAAALSSALRPAPTTSLPGLARYHRAASSNYLEAHWPQRSAAGRHPRRPVPRQCVLPRRPAFAA